MKLYCPKKKKIALFNLDLSGFVFDPSAIAIRFVTLVLGFLLFSALMAAAGSMVPSAKDAGAFSAMFIIGALIPFYASGVVATNPHNAVTQFLTYSPTELLLASVCLGMYNGHEEGVSPRLSE